MERNTNAVRAEAWLRERYPRLSRRQIEEALEAGLCRRQGRHVKKGEKLSAGETLDCQALDTHLRQWRRAEMPELAVIAERPDSVVIDKPAGVKSFPLGIFDTPTVSQWALARYPEIGNAFADPFPTVAPHRLDTGTSGLLIICRNPASLARWRERFAEKRVRKTYEAWCWGTPKKHQYALDVDVAHASGDRRKMVVVRGEVKFREPRLPSQSEIQVVERGEGYFRAQVDCRTGVTHQVRVHLASLGFPLVGDALYDDAYATRPLQPSHHWLRASILETEEGTFRAPMEAFRALQSGLRQESE